MVTNALTAATVIPAWRRLGIRDVARPQSVVDCGYGGLDRRFHLRRVAQLVGEERRLAGRAATRRCRFTRDGDYLRVVRPDERRKQRVTEAVVLSRMTLSRHSMIPARIAAPVEEISRLQI